MYDVHNTLVLLTCLTLKNLKKKTMKMVYLLDATQASIVRNMAIRLCGHDIDSSVQDIRYIAWQFKPGYCRATAVELLGYKGKESGLGEALRNLLPAIGCKTATRA